jgi:hypothetical protein
MKNVKWVVTLLVLISAFSSTAFGFGHYRSDASCDESPRSFSHGYSEKMDQIDDGFVFFPGFEIGMGSGALTTSLGVNIGYKKGLFFAGTSLKGQVVNIDHVNYQFIPASLNISGLSVSRIPETSNSQNEKKLEGWSVGFGLGGKLSFTQLVETDPDTEIEKEYLMVSLGFGF